MFNFIRKNKKIIICLGIAASILILFSQSILAQTTETASPSKLTFSLTDPMTIVQVVLGAILMFISFLLNCLFTLVGQLLSFVINITTFRDIPLVNEGWRIVRDFVNLIFILILLLIGLATILDLQQYGVKKLLPSLLIAALLINFSLPIAGFVLDISQGLTKFFITKMHLTDGDFSKTLSNDLKLGGLSSVSVEIGQGSIGENLKAQLPYMIGGPIGGFIWKAFVEDENPINKNNIALLMLFLKNFIMLIYIFALTVATIFFVVRIAYIWLLLIAAPAAWAAYALPWTKKYFSQWWNQFLNWTFFAPIYLFILYLTLFALQAGKIPEQLSASNAESDIIKSLGVSMQFFIQFAVVILMLLGGIKFALIMAAKSSKTTMGFAEKVAGGVTGLTFAKSLYAGYQAKRKETKTPGIGESWGKMLTSRMGVPLTEKIKASMLGEEGKRRVEKAERDRIDQFKKNNATLSGAELDAKLAKGVSKAEAKATMDLGIERKHISPQMEKYLSLLDKKQREELLMQRPDLYDRFTAEETKDAIGVTITGNRIEDLKNLNIKIHDKGRINDIAKEALQGIDELRSLASVPEIQKQMVDIIKKKGIKATEEINAAMNNGIKEGLIQFTDEDKAIRGVYAVNSGNIEIAFKDATSNINKEALANFIKSVSTQDIAKLSPDLAKSKEIFQSFIQNTTPQKLSSIILNNPKTAEAIVNEINNMTEQEFKDLGANPAIMQHIKKNGNKIGLSFKSGPAPKASSTYTTAAPTASVSAPTASSVAPPPRTPPPATPTPTVPTPPSRTPATPSASTTSSTWSPTPPPAPTPQPTQSNTVSSEDVQKQYEETLAKGIKRVEKTQKEIESYQKDIKKIEKQKQQEEKRKYYTPE